MSETKRGGDVIVRGGTLQDLEDALAKEGKSLNDEGGTFKFYGPDTFVAKRHRMELARLDKERTPNK